MTYYSPEGPPPALIQAYQAGMPAMYTSAQMQALAAQAPYPTGGAKQAAAAVAMVQQGGAQAAAAPLPGAEPQIMQAGIGFAALLPLLARFWPWIAGGLGGVAAGIDIASPEWGMIQRPGTPVIPGTGMAGVGGVPLGGPFAPEPPASMIAKEWAGIGGSRFYLLINGRVVVRKANGTWKLIKRVRMLHMKISNPRMGDVVKADKIVARTAKILRKRLGTTYRRSGGHQRGVPRVVQIQQE